MATYGAKEKKPEPKKMFIAVGVIASLWVLGTLAPDAQEETVATLNRPASQKCNSDSKDCKQWTAWAIKCEENMKRRDEGYMGKLTPYCSAMENLRVRATGIELSTAPGAYNF